MSGYKGPKPPTTRLGALGERVLLDRLLARRLHALAAALAGALSVPRAQAHVLAHWAYYKVSQPHLDTERAAREIGERLRGVAGLSYTAIAIRAAEKGRKALAIKIVEHECRSKLQVPLLLSLGEGGAALRRAAAAGDPDLLHTVLLQLRQTCGKHEFELTIRGYPLAQALYKKHCAQHNRDALLQLLLQEDDFAAQAQLHVRQALEPAQPAHAAANALAQAREAYKKGKNDLGVHIIEEARKLEKQQASLQETYGGTFVGLSLQDTVASLLDHGETKLADKLRAEYGMPDRRYWWVRILSLSSRGEWAELERLSRSKKSPAGYEPFVDACLGRANRDEALKYLPRCRDEIRVKYYVKAGFFEEAADCAFEQKDRSALLYVQNKCPPSETLKHAKIGSLIEQLDARK